MNPEIKKYGEQFKTQYAKIRAAIKHYDKIVVYRHIKPDFDAMGTQMGLVTFLKDNFPNKEIHFVGDNHVSFTPRLFPETERLNDEFYKGKNCLSIICDVGDHERIADPRYVNARTIVKFDHHPFKSEIAKVSVLDLEAASAAEIVADFCLNWKGMKMSPEAASYFYTGIVGDSGRFLYSSTSPHTFAVAETLIGCGISITSIYQKMYEKTIHSLEIQAYVLTHFHVSPHGVSYYLLPTEVQNELGITSEQGKENVNMFSNIAGINAWCSITQDDSPKEPCWRISIRSKGKDISGVANKWGGGGHKQASGAKIDTIDQLDAFIKDLDDLFVEQ
ncbi:MAG: bifunctional oligoribonuclease/PAP phosphatase NrnA [Bacilli bacterium]|jgi:phosphoesterase RecJ-like protein|nr:bifunctional oligoribonuclease/PAP phosphatase NrnA [Bacilli bacterium]